MHHNIDKIFEIFKIVHNFHILKLMVEKKYTNKYLYIILLLHYITYIFAIIYYTFDQMKYLYSMYVNPR